MNQLFLRVANFNIQIDFQPTDLHQISTFFIKKLQKEYQGFIQSEKPTIIHYFIEVIINTQADFLVIKKNGIRTTFINFYHQLSPNVVRTYYQVGIFQFQILLIEILHKLLAENQGFLFHVSGCFTRTRVDIFAGPHGAGKSTIIKLLRTTNIPIADDSIIVKKEGKFHFFQTPFIEKEGYVKRGTGKFSIGRIFVIRKSQSYKIEKIKNKDIVLKEMLKQFWIVTPNYRKQFSILLDFIASTSEFYYLYFGKSKKKLESLINS